MYWYKEFIRAVPHFIVLASYVSYCTGVRETDIQPLPPQLNCNSGSAAECRLCSRGRFANPTVKECVCCSGVSRSGACTGHNCDLCGPGHYQDEVGQTACKPCNAGSFCSESGCLVCTACPAGHETLINRSTICTQCSTGYFKQDNSTYPCSKCKVGYYANSTGQTKCYQCPAGFFCPEGATEPVRCESYQMCPAASDSPDGCEEPWHVKAGDECQPSVTLIAIICVITVPIILTVIVIIIYKLCKYCKRRRLGELYPGERDPLLRGSQHGTRLLQEPVYTGL